MLHEELTDKIRNSKGANLAKAVSLLETNAHDLPGFFANNPKGKLLAKYLSDLAGLITQEQKGILDELAGLRRDVDHIYRQWHGYLCGESESHL
ncbi:MAG TPA: hypothetical protein VEC99_10860 [Clostridia bacterium]|nr:hypothetical protein [Clostridia bacterium]